ncbi:hypothetical protein RYX36_021027 [Vicia faba]
MAEEEKEHSPVIEEDKVLSQVYALILYCDWSFIVSFNIFRSLICFKLCFGRNCGKMGDRCSRNRYCNVVAETLKSLYCRTQLKTIPTSQVIDHYLAAFC